MADGSAKYGDTLNQIVQFLRDQGFNQAEQSLLSEIRGRLDSSSAADQIQASHVPEAPPNSFVQHDALSFVASAGQNVAQIGSTTVLRFDPRWVHLVLLVVQHFCWGNSIWRKTGQSRSRASARSLGLSKILRT